MEPKVLQIPEHVLPEVHRLATLITHYESYLANLRGEMGHLLHMGLGINPNEPGWRLDAEGGVVAYEPPRVPQAVLAPPESVPEAPEDA